MIPTERLPNEGAKAYEAFRIYCDLGSKRNHAAVARKCGKSIHLVRKWSRAHQWKARLSTWQLEELGRARAADEQAKLEHARELESRRETIRENAWKLYGKFITTVDEHLALPQNKSKPVDAARLMQMAELLGRIAAGEQVEAAELSGRLGHGNPVPTAQPLINVIIRHGAETERARKLAGDARPNGRLPNGSS